MRDLEVQNPLHTLMRAPLFSDTAQTYVSTTPNTQWGASVADESRRGWG